MKNKHIYSKPSLTIIEICCEDVIAMSGQLPGYNDVGNPGNNSLPGFGDIGTPTVSSYRTNFFNVYSKDKK